MDAAQRFQEWLSKSNRLALDEDLEEGDALEEDFEEKLSVQTEKLPVLRGPGSNEASRRLQ